MIVYYILTFYFNREDSISRIADEAIEGIIASYNSDKSNEEGNDKRNQPLRQFLVKKKRKSAISKQNELIEELKNSLSGGNESIGSIEKHDFEELKEAKQVIISIRNELEFHQKQTIQYGALAGKTLKKVQKLCQIENKKFPEFLKECGINWSKSYIYFLISFYNFSKKYPKICNISLSTYFVKNNFKSIKLAISSSDDEKKFWK